MNLKTIKLLADTFDCEVGLSDHTLSNTVAIASISLGVKIIEKHFTLSRDDGGPDAAFSIEPDELRNLCSNVNTAFTSLGTASFEMKKAENENSRFRRSIYVVRDVKMGEVFTEGNLRRIRPGFGLPPKFYAEMLGKKAKKDINAGTAADFSFYK